jgi:hypothetical protein
LLRVSRCTPRWQQHENPRHGDDQYRAALWRLPQALRIHLQNDELLERGEIVTGFVTPQPVFTVSKISAGGIYDFVRTQNMKIGLGALASRYCMPDALRSEYGDPTSYMIFARLEIQ